MRRSRPRAAAAFSRCGAQACFVGPQLLPNRVLLLQPLQLGCRRLAECDHRVQRLPVLALQVVEQRQPLLGGRAGGRVEVQPLTQVGHVARQLDGLGLQRARSLGRRGEALVQGSRLRQLGARGGQRVQPGRLIAQGADRGVGRAGNRLGVGGAAQLPLQGLVLARLHRCGRDLVDLVAQQLHPARQLVLVGEHLRGLGDGPTPRAVRRCHFQHAAIQLPETIEQGQLPVAGQQALLLMLSVDLGQPRAQRGEAAHRHAAVVDAHHGAPVGANLAPDDGHPLAGGEHVGQRVVLVGGDIGEDRFDTRRIGPGPHLVGGGTCAQRQGQRVDDQ